MVTKVGGLVRFVCFADKGIRQRANCHVGKEHRLAGRVAKSVEQNSVVRSADRAVARRNADRRARSNLEVIRRDVSELFSGAQCKTELERGEKMLDVRCAWRRKNVSMEPHVPVNRSRPPGWWSRNWKWFVPTGCCLAPLVLGGAFSAFVVARRLRCDEADRMLYKAVARAKADSRVTSALGTSDRRRLVFVRKHKCEWQFGRGRSQHPDLRPKREGDHLRRRDQVCGRMDVLEDGREDRQLRRNDRSQSLALARIGVSRKRPTIRA